MRTLVVPTQANRFGLSHHEVRKYILSLRGKTPKAWQPKSQRSRNTYAWHASNVQWTVGRETATASGTLLTRMEKSPPTWLVEVPTPDGGILKLVLVKGAKTTARKSRWLLTGPGITALFPSRKRALAACLEVEEVEPEAVNVPHVDAPEES